MHLAPRRRLGQTEPRHERLLTNILGGSQEDPKDRRSTRENETGASADDDDVADVRDLVDDLLGQMDDLLARVEQRIRIRRRPARAHARLQRRKRSDETLHQGSRLFVLRLDVTGPNRETAGDFLDQPLVDDFRPQL